MTTVISVVPVASVVVSIPISTIIEIEGSIVVAIVSTVVKLSVVVISRSSIG